MDIRTCRQTLLELEAEASRLRDSLKEIESAEKFFRRKLGDLEQHTPPLTSGRLPTNLTQLTVAEAAAKVIESVGKPMRSGEIAQRLVKAGFEDKKSLPVTVTTAILRREDLFKKVDRGLFALKNGDP